MKIPPVATFAACGSLITASKSIWELTRMIRAKQREAHQQEEIHELLEELRDYVTEGIITKREFRAFRHQVEDALERKDITPKEARSRILDFEDALFLIQHEHDNDGDDERYQRGRGLDGSRSRSQTPQPHRRRHHLRSRSSRDGMEMDSLPPTPTMLPSQYQAGQLYQGSGSASSTGSSPVTESRYHGSHQRGRHHQRRHDYPPHLPRHSSVDADDEYEEPYERYDRRRRW